MRKKSRSKLARVGGRKDAAPGFKGQGGSRRNEGVGLGNQRQRKHPRGAFTGVIRALQPRSLPIDISEMIPNCRRNLLGSVLLVPEKRRHVKLNKPVIGRISVRSNYREQTA
jgi:hypothetical protein